MRWPQLLVSVGILLKNDRVILLEVLLDWRLVADLALADILEE